MLQLAHLYHVMLLRHMSPRMVHNNNSTCSQLDIFTQNPDWLGPYIWKIPVYRTEFIQCTVPNRWVVSGEVGDILNYHFLIINEHVNDYLIFMLNAHCL